MEEITTLREAEDFISGVHKGMAIGTAHIAVTLASIRRDRLFIEVAQSWKGYIHQDRNNLGYENSKRLCRIGDIYLTFRDQLEENNIKLSENMSKMELFDPEIASIDPVFYDKFKDLSYRGLKRYIANYREARYTSTSGGITGDPVTEKGASLYIGDKKVRGINLNEVKREAAAGKRAVVIWVDDDSEARRVKRRMGK